MPKFAKILKFWGGGATAPRPPTSYACGDSEGVCISYGHFTTPPNKIFRTVPYQWTWRAAFWELCSTTHVSMNMGDYLQKKSNKLFSSVRHALIIIYIFPSARICRRVLLSLLEKSVRRQWRSQDFSTGGAAGGESCLRGGVPK